MKLLKTLAFVCLCVPMWGQGYRYDSNAFTSANNVPPGSQSTLFTIPFAKITVCAYPDNGGQPCTNTVPIYQDPALTVTALNPITADVHGRFGFWKAAGFYTFSVVSPGGEFLGTYIISLGGAGGATTVALTTNGTSGPSTLTGNPASGYLLNVPDYQTSGAFQQQVIPPVTGQYVVIYPTSVVATDVQRATVVTSPGSIGAQVSFRIGCGGLTECSAILTWSGFTLPSYVDPASVTAIYVFGNYSGGEMTLSHASYTPPLTDAFLSDAAFGTPMHQSTSLTTLTGAQVAGSTLQWVFDRTLPVDIGIIPNANIASVGLIVYYTGPAPPTNTSIIVDPPLFFNGTSLDLGIDPLAINFLQPLTAGQLPAASAASGDIYQVTDGTSSSDCTTGGGSTVNLCRSNGTIWSVYSSGGGGSGTVSGQANGVIPLATASTTIGAQSHLDDGVTTAATITSSEPIAVAGSTHGVSIPAGPAVAGAAGKVIYASDATSGFAEVNENNTGLSRVCTAFNYGSICPSAGSSPLTTKGDLYGFSTVNARVPVGSDGQVLTADSTQTLGLKWAAGGGSGTSNPYTCTVQSTNLKCLGIAPYSATTGGDNSALLQQAITDLSSVGGGDIYVPCGVYPLTGALQDPTGANAIVQMPKIIAYSGTPIGIHIHGCAIPAQSGLTTGVTVFSTTETTGNIFGGYEATSGGFGPLTNVYLSFENIVIRQPPNPQMAAINATNIVGLRLDHVWCDVSGTPVTPTNTTGACVLAPTIANSAFVQLYDVTAVNTYTGFVLGEHTTFDGLYGSVLHDGFIFESAATLVGNANSVHGGYAWCQLCVNQVISGGLNPIALDISNMDLESTSGNGILDTGNLLYGTLNYHVPAASGAVTPANPNVSGAANLHYHNLDFPGIAVSADAATNGGGGTNATWNWYAGTSTPHISWSNPTPGNLTWTSSVSSGAGLFVNNSSTNANAYSYLGECNAMTHCTLTANIPATSGLPAIYPKDGLYQASNSVMVGGSTYNTEGAYPLKLATNNTVRLALDGAGAGAFTLATHTSLTENGEVVCTASNSACSGTIASGTSALGTSAISSGACATAVTTTATGTATTDVVGWGFNADPTSTTGYSPTTNGMLTIIAYPTANNVSFKVCNNTSASVTPGAVTLNWRVAR